MTNMSSEYEITLSRCVRVNNIIKNIEVKNSINYNDYIGYINSILCERIKG